MSALRVLGLSYLAIASLFSLALFFSDHAALRMMTARQAAALSQSAREKLIVPLIAFARLEDEKIFDPQVTVPLSAPGPNDARLLAHADVPAMPEKKVAAPEISPAQPVIIAPDLPDLPQSSAGEGYGGLPAPALPAFKAPEAFNPPMPDMDGPSGLTQKERDAVTARLMQTLSPAMLKNFDLFLYVSKAKNGPLAQRLYIFRKDSVGTLHIEYDWAASTGREVMETSPQGVRGVTTTPAGFYELDPTRMYRAYHSTAWDQSMPYAMFFNWQNHGDQTGLAIHAAVGEDIEKLGSRASAGCVHISPGHARQLFEMIRADYKGKVPRFAFDGRSATMSNQGELMTDRSGNLVMEDGYRVLIDIENNSGANLVSALGG